MTKPQLKLSISQYSSRGRKPLNQDCIGFHYPKEPLLSTKGCAIALADGISSSDVSQSASETAVNGFLHDYFSTSEAWSVKASAQRVLQATNSWLHAQSVNGPHRFNRDKGYVCTFSGLVIKSHNAHLLHTGDSRIYRLHGNTLEQLTEDHCRQLDDGNIYLSRALGINQQLDLQYQSLDLEEGDVFFLATDGVYDFIDGPALEEIIETHADEFEHISEKICEFALANGSNDNLSAQIIRIDQLPQRQLHEIQSQVETLTPPPPLKARSSFEGYYIEREIYISSRSHVYLGIDNDTGEKAVIKIPSVEMRDDPLYLERFMMEDWIARRLDNAHVLKAAPVSRKRQHLFLATEYIEGDNLAQWIQDHPAPSLEQVRAIIEQIAKGLQAFHRQEMVHQDLRPNNVLLDRNGTAKIIDFGAVQVAGIADISPTNDIQGTAQYSAPEYFIGETGKARSDIFSLGVICYQMFTGQLPLGPRVSNATNVKLQQKLHYTPVRQSRDDIPEWIDHAIRKAVSVDPRKRYQEVSEFIADIRRPNKTFLRQTKPPLIERNPVAFWQTLSAILMLIIIYLLSR